MTVLLITVLALGAAGWLLMVWSLCRAAARGDVQLEHDRRRV